MSEQQPVPREAVQAATEAVNACRIYAVSIPGEKYLLVAPEDEAHDVLVAAAPFIRAQVIRELRDAASDEGPQSAYWLAADLLERK